MLLLLLYFTTGNRFNGTIPPELSQWKHVNQLGLADNQFSGTLPPELAQLDLLYFYLGNNQLTGTIPPEYGRFKNLLEFQVYNNHLNGTLPKELGQMINVTNFQVNNNRFTGLVPPELGKMSKMRHFVLSNNEFSHSLLPLLFENFPLLNFLDIVNNSFTGSLPDSICTTYNLNNLYLSYNHLSGSLPDCLGNLDGLAAFDLDHNMITGSLDVMMGLDAIAYVNFESNFLSGTLPSGFETMGYLFAFSISNNHLTGELPQSLIGFSSGLNLLNLEHNFFSGTLPSSFCSNWLVILTVSHNLLSGPVPVEISDMLSLEILFLCNNAFSGSLTSAFDAALQTELSYVDVSNNQFTGAIPVEAFGLMKLTSFAAVSNCLSGTIPADICAASNLTTIAMDGLTSASSCQQRFFPSGFGISSYGLSSTNKAGSVPECLYSMPLLETLHLSGNGLTGSIPEHVVLGAALRDMSLSHNVLTGPVPDQVYYHSWDNLDLSYNKLDGTLPSAVHSVAWNASLSINVNRLSGEIPSALQQAKHIAMLDGNLFECGTSRSELPVHDSYNEIYECGSNTFNYAMYSWMTLAVVAAGIVAAGLLMLTFSSSRVSITTKALLSVSEWLDPFDATTDTSNNIDDDENSSLDNVVKFGRFMRAMRMSCAVISLFIIIVLMPTFATLSSLYDTYDHEYAWAVTANYLSGLTPTIVLLVFFVLFGVVFIAAIRIRCYPLRVENSHRYSVKAVVWTTSQYCTVVSLVLWNLVLVTGVNIAYVYINHNYRSTIVHTAQLCVALFKVAWNGWVVDTVLQLSSFSDRRSSNRPKHIALAVFVILFNNIAAPFIATAYVSSNCFYSAVVAPPAVEVSYSYKSCTSSLFVGNYSLCNSYDNAVAARETSYAPPFIYSYQCSSTFVTTYASIYVFMFTIEAFATPLLLWTLKWAHSQTAHSFMSKIANRVLPAILKPVPTSFVTSDLKYFACDSFAVRMVNMYAILSTFGVILPPVAAVCCVTMYCVTYHTQLLIGRLVSEAQHTSNYDVLSIISSDCGNAVEMFGSAVWIVIPFAAVFYSLFLFDTLGDAMGWREALWAPAVMCSLPVLLWMVQWVAQKRDESRGRSRSRSLSADGSRVEYRLSDGTRVLYTNTDSQYNVLSTREEDVRSDGAIVSSVSSTNNLDILLMDNNRLSDL